MASTTGTLQPSERMALAAQRSKAVSERLRAVARVNRFAASGGRRTGSRAAVRERRTSLLVWLFAFVLPAIGAIAYYGFILSPLYVTRMDLAVRGAEMMMMPDKDGLSRLAALDTIQNTMIVVDYLKGPTLVEDLEKRIPLRAIYASPHADEFSRLKPDAPVEDLQKFLHEYIESSIMGSSLAVRVKVKAFTPEDSIRVAQAVQAACEEMINKLSVRSRETATAEAQAQLKASEAQLAGLNDRMRELRNQQGMVDATAAAKQGLALLLSIEKERVEADVQLRSLETRLDPTAPSIRRLREQKEQLDRAVDEQKQAMASSSQNAAVLANKMQLFEDLDIRRKAAEKSYVELLKVFQIARIQAERQQVFLNTIVAPREPESAQEPHRVFWIAIWLGGLLLGTFSLNALRRLAL